MQRVPRMASKYYDIGVNITDPMFRGVYHSRQCHEGDLKHVLSRAVEHGVHKMLVTGSSIAESRANIELMLASAVPGLELKNTIGVHPCSVNEFLPVPSLGDANSDHATLKNYSFQQVDELPFDSEFSREKLSQLRALVETGPVTAFGEIGLDYDRLHYSSQQAQLYFFKKQLELACEFKLPLFLHMRAACDDFVMLLQPYVARLGACVVHSFTGSKEELRKLLELGCYIGVNGCGLKTEENLEVVKEIPLDKIMLETDAPWCEMRKTHAGWKYVSAVEIGSVKKEKGVADKMVKGRNEPCLIRCVAECVAAVKGVEMEVVVQAAWENACRVY